MKLVGMNWIFIAVHRIHLTIELDDELTTKKN